MDGRFTKKEEKAKQEEPAKEEKKEEKALTKTSRWSKLWNAIKHPIQTIKAARAGKAEKIAKEASEKGEEPIVQPLKIEDLQGNEKTPTAEKTEAQSVDAFIAKLRQMSEKEAAKDAQNKDNKEQPDYLKYVARHARKVEAQKQRDDEGR